MAAGKVVLLPPALVNEGSIQTQSCEDTQGWELSKVLLLLDKKVSVAVGNETDNPDANKSLQL